MIGIDMSQSEFIVKNKEKFNNRETIERKIRYEKAQYENEILRINRDAVRYSGFDGEWLSQVIADVMGKFEGNQYISFVARDDYKVGLKGLTTYHSYLPITFISGIASFYELNYTNFTAGLSTSLLADIFQSNFPYLKEFVDLLIDFRIKNNKKEIVEEELEIIKTTFFESKKEEIRKKYIANNEKTFSEMEALKKEYMEKIGNLEKEIEFRTEALNNGLQVSKQKKMTFNNN